MGQVLVSISPTDGSYQILADLQEPGTYGAVYFDVKDTLLYERQIRNFALTMGGMVFTAEHPMNAEEARRAIIPGTLSFALELGRTLVKNRGNAAADQQLACFSVQIFRQGGAHRARDAGRGGRVPK